MLVGMGLALGWDRDLGTGRAKSDSLSNNCRNGLALGWDTELGTSIPFK